MKQGDVYWYTFRAPDKLRPVLILTRSSAISYLTGITVAQITTTIRGTASEVLLTPGDDGVLTECVVNTDNIHTIQKTLLAISLQNYRLSACAKCAQPLNSRWDLML